MFSLSHFHFEFKSVNISTILTSKLKTCTYVWKLVFWLLPGTYISCGESSVNKQIRLNRVLFLHRDKGKWRIRNIILRIIKTIYIESRIDTHSGCYIIVHISSFRMLPLNDENELILSYQYLPEFRGIGPIFSWKMCINEKSWEPMKHGAKKGIVRYRNIPLPQGPKFLIACFLGDFSDLFLYD